MSARSRVMAGAGVPLLLVALGQAPAAAPRGASESLRRHALQILRATLDTEEGWVKVHAAEALLSVGAPDEVTRAFERELASRGGEPEYRIGIWRVLAQAARGDRARDPWIKKIVAAFLDTRGPDRLHAAETLGKLGYRANGREVEAFALAARAGRGSLAVNARWVLANSRRAGEAGLMELLASDDAGTRGDAAYAVRHRSTRSSAAWKTLAAAARREPVGSRARASLIGAAFVHAPPDQAAAFNADVLSYVRRGTKDEQLEACAALAIAGTEEDVAFITALLDARDPDVRVAAAQAILRIDRRGVAR